MKTFLKFLAVLAVASGLFVSTIVASVVIGLSSGNLVARAQEPIPQLCQMEGTTIAVTIYMTIPAFERAAGHVPLPSLNANQVINVGECATSNSTGIQYIYFQSATQSYSGEVRLGDLQLAVKQPATPTPISAQATLAPSLGAAEATVEAPGAAAISHIYCDERTEDCASKMAGLVVYVAHDDAGNSVMVCNFSDIGAAYPYINGYTANPENWYTEFSYLQNNVRQFVAGFTLKAPSITTCAA